MRIAALATEEEMHVAAVWGFTIYCSAQPASNGLELSFAVWILGRKFE